MRRCPPSYEWLRTQPVGWVAEVMLAWMASMLILIPRLILLLLLSQSLEQRQANREQKKEEWAEQQRNMDFA